MLGCVLSTIAARGSPALSMSKSDGIAMVLSTSLSSPIRPSPILKTHYENCLFAFMSTTDALDKSLMFLVKVRTSQ